MIFLIKNVVLNFINHVFFFWKYMNMIGKNILLILVSLYFSEIQEKSYPLLYMEKFRTECLWPMWVS